LTGTTGRDYFLLTSPGATLTNFQVGTDQLEIVSNNQPLTFFDLIARFQFLDPVTGTLGALIRDESGGSVVSTPNGARGNRFVTLQGVTAEQLANSPESFRIRSQGNTVIDWNEITFDAARVIGIPPASSTRYFAMVHTAIQDAVQGVLQTAGRSTYLQSIGETLPSVGAGASAEAATAAAAARVLTSLFTDPNNPVVFGAPQGPNSTLNPNVFVPLTGDVNRQEIPAYFPRAFSAALNQSLAEINASLASIDAGVNFGREIADRIIALRSNDGAFRNADGTPVNFAAFNQEYQDGIEPNDDLNETVPQNQPPQQTNDGTVGRLQDGTLLVNSSAPVNTVSSTGVTTNSTARTTPGAWRRGEDTLRADGTFAPLASPEFTEINRAWVLPSTNFFNENVLPPPALDSDRYRDNVAEVRAEGSIRDIPISGAVMVTGSTVTENGTTRFISGNTSVGDAINDTDTADQSYGPGDRGNDIGRSGPDGIGRTSAERTIIAHVWANAEGSYGPNYAWQKIAQQLAINNNSSLADTAYVFGSLNVGIADGFINIWDIKWDEDYFWRPVSSVRNADQLGSTGSLDDNTWTPREVTPQHPCHPSGTSMTAGVASSILANFYGDRQTFTVSADPHPNSARPLNALTDTNGDGLKDVLGTPLEEVSRTYTSLAQAADESRTSRIYAGAHFRFATENGVNMGEQVASYFLRHNPFSRVGTLTGTA